MAVQEIQINDVAGPIIVNAGYMIIAKRDYPDPDTTEIVFGVRPNLCEYVTWLRVHGNEYYHGHYFPRFDDAIKDFQTRT